MKRDLPPHVLAAARDLTTNFEAFAVRVLKILPKAGGSPIPFTLNTAQKFLHRKIEEQRETLGKVRAIVLKGRQQGVSTYTEGRLYWRVSHQRGKRAMILTHEAAATANLFGMVDRYWQMAPENYRPHLGASNAKELIFDLLDSRYDVATAGAKDTGRGGTAQFLHGSEVGFWPHAAQHLEGIGQVVPDLPGTEIIYESTANGTANVFHELWQAANRGATDFVPVFIPWLWQDEYQTPPPAGFELTAEEDEYAEAYGATLAQMAWRRLKTAADFREDPTRFDQEYPATAALAFASSSPRALIKMTLVELARKSRDVEAVGPKIMGVDVAEYGDDFTTVYMRQGRVARKLGKWGDTGTMETAGRVGVIADKEKPDAIVVDATGVGTGTADRLREEGYPAVRAHFGESPRDINTYVNARDEMWSLMRDWFADKPASIDDSDDLAAQLTGVQYTYDSKRRIKLESKEKMKERGLRSPDDADGLALTFYPSAGMNRADDAAKWRARRG